MRTYVSRYDESVVYEAEMVFSAEMGERMYEIRLPGTDEGLALIPVTSFEAIYVLKDYE